MPYPLISMLYDECFDQRAGAPEVGGQGGHVPPQVLGYQLTLFGPRGVDYARLITTCPPIFSDDAAFLYWKPYLQFSIKAIICESILALFHETFLIIQRAN